MFRISSLLLLLVIESHGFAQKPPVHLWCEQEWFDGVKGSFGYWTGDNRSRWCGQRCP
ncbi:hypothetical protein [Zavarzinella formosa]|uniref:hypothetical protein n=1 Tax=Zavarzinella formosa TaxID=360055 RepID=UPI0002EF3017|nr:hypothetical protein [Zavarzinella formosa]